MRYLLLLTFFIFAGFQSGFGQIKQSTQDSTLIDSVRYDNMLKEAEFPGGNKAWKNYFNKNVDPLVPLNNQAKKGTYQVKVRFTVTEEGQIVDAQPITKCGYGMEEEVIRILTTSPLWIPATQNGKKVKDYKIQPMTFFVD